MSEPRPGRVLLRSGWWIEVYDEPEALYPLRVEGGEQPIGGGERVCISEFEVDTQRAPVAFRLSQAGPYNSRGPTVIVRAEEIVGAIHD